MSKVVQGQGQGLELIRLSQVQHGRQLTRILTSCAAMGSEYPDDLSDEERGEVEKFLVDLDVFFQVGNSIEFHSTMEFEQCLGEQLRDLNGYGLHVFLGTSPVLYADGHGRHAAHVLVARSSDPRSQPDSSGFISAFRFKEVFSSKEVGSTANNDPSPDENNEQSSSSDPKGESDDSGNITVLPPENGPEKFERDEGDISAVSGNASPDDSSGLYSMKRDGEVWKVVFEGRSFSITDSMGFRYLEHLLYSPGDSIECLDLEKKTGPLEKGVRCPNSIQLANDERAIGEIKKELAGVLIELEDAKSQGNDDAIERLEEEERVLKKQLGPWRTTLDSSNSEKARNNVRKAIKRVVKKLETIKGPGEAFADHIKKRVRTGHRISYDPSNEIKWG